MSSVRFRSDREKWEYLRSAWIQDSREEPVCRIADYLWRAVERNPLAFAKLAHAFCRDVVTYQTDTARVGREDIARRGELSEVLRSWRMRDDCDTKARLFVALCRAVGIPASMVPHWAPDSLQPGGKRLAHVSAAVLLPAGEYPVELTLARARLGEVSSDVPKERDGNWKT